MRIRQSIVAGALVLALAAPAAVGGADLIEPWEPGLSDLELYLSLEEGGRPTSAVVVGAGLAAGFSAGLALTGGGDPTDVGLVLVWSRGLGRWGELDLFAEATAAAHEVELDGLGTAYGFEWSATAAGPRPYLRLHAADHEGAWRLHPLVGWNVPFERVDLHVELSSEEPESGGDWPLHLAIGPNFGVGRGIELLPELSLLYEPAGNEVAAALTVGVVTSPRALRAALGGAGAR